MGRKVKDQAAESANMTKEQKAQHKMMESVAKHLRFKVPTKNAVIKGQKVEYFQGEKALDCLLASKWSKEPKDVHDSLTPYFKTRANAIDFCFQLLQKKFFIRANKVEVKPKSDDQTNTASSSKESESSSSLRKRGEKATDSPRAKKGDASDSDTGKKRKKKYRLEIHQQQVFVDSADDVYFWQYDPPSHSSYLVGAAVVIGAVALTMQPLWPDSTRAGMWYLSMGVFILMGVMVVLIIGRWFLYGVVLVVSLGKIKFWILPNLDNEKLGVVDSFKPFYSFEYKDSDKGSKGRKKRKDKDKGKDAEKVSKDLTVASGDTKEENLEEEEELEEEGGREIEVEDDGESEQTQQITN